jgi:hypothetical protein
MAFAIGVCQPLEQPERHGSKRESPVVKCAEFKCISAAFFGLRTQLADLEVVDLVLSVTQTSRRIQVASLLPSCRRRL